MQEHNEDHLENLDAEARIVAHLFGELSSTDAAAFEGELSLHPSLAAAHARLGATAALVKGALPPEALSPELRATLLAAAEAEQRATTHRAGFALLPRGVVRAAVGLAAAALVVIGLRPWLVEEERTTEGDVALLEPSSPAFGYGGVAPRGGVADKEADAIRFRGGLPDQADPVTEAAAAEGRFKDEERLELDSLVVLGDSPTVWSLGREPINGGFEADGEPADTTLKLSAEGLSAEAKAQDAWSRVQAELGAAVRHVALDADQAADAFGLYGYKVDPGGGGGGGGEDADVKLLNAQREVLLRESLVQADLPLPARSLSIVGQTMTAGENVALGLELYFEGAPAPGEEFYAAGVEGDVSALVTPTGLAELQDQLSLFDFGLVLGNDARRVSTLERQVVRVNGQLDAQVDELRRSLYSKKAAALSQSLDAAGELTTRARGMSEAEWLHEQHKDRGAQLESMGYVSGDDATVEEEPELAAVLSQASRVPVDLPEDVRALTRDGQNRVQAEPPASDAVPAPQVSDEAVTRMTDLLHGRILGGLAPLEGEGAGQLFFRYWGDNAFVPVDESALSTFAADVDTGSFGVVRRTLRAQSLPVPEQVRTEELVNWWRPDVPAPQDGSDFAIVMEASPSRFHADSDMAMLRVALRGREVERRDRKPLALTLVIDVSGSMDDHGRIEIVREALKLLLRELSTTDSIAMVTFGTEAHTLVAMTSAANRGPFEDTLDTLDPDGGTNVEAGLVAGFELAAAELTPGAVNRVVFLSDGVGNIGETDQARILARVGEERAKGVYLSTIGVGYGVDSSEEYADDFLEQLADNGDGVYHNVNDAADAERYLVDQFTQTLEPIARDVKIQVEFNPDQVVAWRQLGYENRSLTAQQFRDDAVDAGEVHSGHQVNALYEVRLRPGLSAGDPLATARVRWKQPFAIDAGDASSSGTEEAEVAAEVELSFDAGSLAQSYVDTSLGYRRAVLIAQLAELLRRSEHATGDAPSELLDEMEALAPFLADVDFDELLGLLRDLRPALQALAEDLGPIDHKVDEIRRRQIEMLSHREQLDRVQADEVRKQLQGEVDRVRTEIDKLEGELHDLLAKELGPPAEESR